MQLPLNLSRMWCLAKFELIRLFFTKSGLLSLAVFSTIWFGILYYLVASAVDIMYNSEFKSLAQSLFGGFGLSELFNWPVAELAVFWLVALYSFPFFALIISSDQTCADRDRGTLRFISLRATRLEIIFGRFLGQVIIIAILIALTLLATLIMAGFRDLSLLTNGVAIASNLFFELIIIVLPFIALMTFFNSFTKSSRAALGLCTLFFGVLPLIISLIAYQLPALAALQYIFPGYQISNVVNAADIGITDRLLPIAQMIAYLSVAQLVMKRSSL
ncbi:ABC transporter permease subunit [Colwelliaceae bacterium BS250]